MKKGEEYQGTVVYSVFPNKGMVQVEDALVTVKNALPGQRVLFRLTKRRHNRYEGTLLKVLAPAPYEDSGAACPHAGVCGGCLYQTVPYDKQLELKEEQVLSLLHPVLPDIGDLFEGIRPSPRQDGYRNKMEYTFGDEYKDGPLSLGMHKRGAFYDIVPVKECRIADGDFGRILDATLKYFREREIPHYHRMRHTGYLRHLLVRKAVKTGEILADLVTTSAESTETELLEGWRDCLLDLELSGHLTGILHTVNDSVADTITDQGTECLYGQMYFYEEILGLRFQIRPFSFFQTNSLGAEVLYETARSYIAQELETVGRAMGSISEQKEKRGKVVYDLYSGTGTIAQLLAPAAKKVIGVEIVSEAVEAARRNAEENGLSNCEFLAGDVLKVLDEIKEKPDLIVLDPPRDGVHPKALKQIVSYGVESILYISCKATSLARDLISLQEGGYRVKRICCVDMFPSTANVETVVYLDKKKPKDYVEIGVDAEVYYRIKNPEKNQS